MNALRNKIVQMVVQELQPQLDQIFANQVRLERRAQNLENRIGRIEQRQARASEAMKVNPDDVYGHRRGSSAWSATR